MSHFLGNMINQSECKNEMQNFSYNNCFICGAKQTFWILNSKPSTGFPKKPFFPFIQHHPNRNNQQKLNTSKECYACNVCYFLLLQQWKSFENEEQNETTNEPDEDQQENENVRPQNENNIQIRPRRRAAQEARDRIIAQTLPDS